MFGHPDHFKEGPFFGDRPLPIVVTTAFILNNTHVHDIMFI